MKQKLIDIDSENAFTKIIIKFMSRPTAISLSFICIIFVILLVTITYILTKLGVFSCMKNIFKEFCCPKDHHLIKYETQENFEILFRNADEFVTNQITTSLTS